MLTKRLTSICGCAVLIVLFLGCPPPEGREIAPNDRPSFPSGLAQVGNFLAVVSSNFDLRYDTAGIFWLDLGKIDEMLDRFDENVSPEKRVIKGNEIGALRIDLDAFGGSPGVFINQSIQSNLLVATREKNLLTNFSIEGNILGAPQNIALNMRDPFVVETLEKNGKNIAIVSALTGSELKIIRFSGSKANLADKSIVLPSLESSVKNVESKATKVRVKGMSVYHSKDATKDPVLVVAVETFPEGETVFLPGRVNSARLIWFDLTDELLKGGTVSKDKFKELDLTKRKLGKRIHGLRFSPDGSDLYVIMQNNDSLIRVDLRLSQNEVEPPVIKGVNSTCKEPIDLVVDENQVFVACFKEHAIASYDRFSLRELKVNRGFGLGPIKLLIDKRPAQNDRLYVSYFLDNSIGIFDKRLKPTARIFKRVDVNNDGEV